MPFDTGEPIDAARLNRIQPVLYDVAATGPLNLGTALADVPGASIPLTTATAGALFEAIATFDMNISTAGTAGQLAEGHLDVDGVDQTRRALKNMAVVDRITVTQTWSGILSAAGNHTFKLRGIKGSSGAASIIQIHTALIVKIYEVF